LFPAEVGDVFELNGLPLTVAAEVSGTSFYYSTPTVWLPIGDVQQQLFAGQSVVTAVIVRGELDAASSRRPTSTSSPTPTPAPTTRGCSAARVTPSASSTCSSG